ncbi:MAG: hypothetical protein WKG07_37885 [Hymenobacter sp.]
MPAGVLGGFGFVAAGAGYLEDEIPYLHLVRGVGPARVAPTFSGSTDAGRGGAKYLCPATERELKG